MTLEEAKAKYRGKLVRVLPATQGELGDGASGAWDGYEGTVRRIYETCYGLMVELFELREAAQRGPDFRIEGIELVEKGAKS